MSLCNFDRKDMTKCLFSVKSNNYFQTEYWKKYFLSSNDALDRD